MKFILVFNATLMACVLQASGQQQSQATCDALNASITNAADGANLGVCSVDMECLAISCMGFPVGNTTLTLFPCEETVVVNFRIVGGSGSLERNVTGTTSIPIGLGSAINIIVQPLSQGTGITLGVNQQSFLLTVELFATTAIPLQCQPVTTQPSEATTTTTEATTTETTTAFEATTPGATTRPPLSLRTLRLLLQRQLQLNQRLHQQLLLNKRRLQKLSQSQQPLLLLNRRILQQVLLNQRRLRQLLLNPQLTRQLFLNRQRLQQLLQNQQRLQQLLQKQFLSKLLLNRRFLQELLLNQQRLQQLLQRQRQ